MNEFNDTGKKLRANKRVSNYTAYSGYEVHPEPRTQYQELNEKQRKMFEGFKQADERPENMPVKKFINEQQIQPLEKMEDNYTKKLDKINSNYANLDTNINTIMNNDETGIRDKLMNDDKYKSYSSVELEKSKNVSDIRLDDTKALIEYNNSVFNLGVVTATTLLVAGIVVARE
tara:strand:+ start:3094 stop:3615 length:522 start_codon:yes stop_codon:yes gene_type:complete